MRIYKIHKLGDAAYWPVGDEPSGLSVNKEHNVLVTCSVVRKIKEFTTGGRLVRQLTLPDNVTNPLHAIQLINDQFVVCHGGPGDQVHRVCVVAFDPGHKITHILHSSGIGQYNVPSRLAVDNDGYIFVGDINNQRVTLLSPSPDMQVIQQIVSASQLRGDPLRLCLDTRRRRLYVVVNEWQNRQYISGRVVVLKV